LNIKSVARDVQRGSALDSLLRILKDAETLVCSYRDSKKITKVIYRRSINEQFDEIDKNLRNTLQDLHFDLFVDEYIKRGEESKESKFENRE
jgi:hypothetical protein